MLATGSPSRPAAARAMTGTFMDTTPSMNATRGCGRPKPIRWFSARWPNPSSTSCELRLAGGVARGSRQRGQQRVQRVGVLVVDGPEGVLVFLLGEPLRLPDE